VLGCVYTYTAVYAVKTISNGGTRETRDGWPLLSVENEVNGAHRVQMKGVLPSILGWFALGLVVPVQETFILPWLLW
jgi:hypothetical protein